MKLYSTLQNGDLCWRKKLGGPVLATPVRLSGGRVAVASLRGEVAALQTCDGSEVWLTQLDSPVYSSPCSIATLLVVAEVSGVVHALEPETGNKVSTLFKIKYLQVIVKLKVFTLNLV